MHVCNDLNHFKGELVKDRTFQVAKIGGNHDRANGTGSVVWKWKDDNDKLLTFEANAVLYSQTLLSII